MNLSTQSGPPPDNQALKTTALQYLGEALWTESYENCAELIGQAKSFGASQSEISAVLNGYLKTFSGTKGFERKSRLEHQKEQR